MKHLFLYSIPFILLLGCISEKKARFRAEQFYKEHPDELAKTCSEKFPPTSQYIKGITITKRDTTIQKSIVLNCPETINPVTKQKYIPKINGPGERIISISKTRVDTIKVENVAKVIFLTMQLEKANSLMLEGNKLNLSLQTKIEESKKKSDKLLYILIGIGTLLGISVFLRFKNII